MDGACQCTTERFPQDAPRGRRFCGGTSLLVFWLPSRRPCSILFEFFFSSGSGKALQAVAVDRHPRLRESDCKCIQLGTPPGTVSHVARWQAPHTDSRNVGGDSLRAAVAGDQERDEPRSDVARWIARCVGRTARLSLNMSSSHEHEVRGLFLTAIVPHTILLSLDVSVLKSVGR